jgi:predicted glutamine amidotransferase
VSPNNYNGTNGDGASDTSVDSSSYREQVVSLDAAESKPGRVLADVDPHTAAFIVTSNPLTAGHVWHKMPQNSIMWCTRGSHPELRLLQRRQHRYSVMDLKVED